MDGKDSGKNGDKENPQQEQEQQGISMSAVALGGVAALTGAALLGWGLSSVFGAESADSDSDAGKKGKKMMKVPGKDEYIPREDFERDPQGKFREWRGKK